MPSPTPSAPYIYPRVNADGTGLEWVSVSEILDDLAGLSARAGQRYLIDTSALATGNYAAAVGQAILQGSVAATAAGSVALQGASSANAGGSSVIAFPGAASAGGSASIGTVQFQTLASALGSAAVQTSLVATAAGSLVLTNSAYTTAVGSGVVLGTVVAQTDGSAAVQLPAVTAETYGSAILSARLAATAGGSGVILLVAKGTATGSAYISAGSDTTAPNVPQSGAGSLLITGGSGGGTFSVTATDAVGITKWKLVEGASDPGAADPGQTGATVVASTTTLTLTNQAFTSTATSTATRYFRWHCWDAAGNHGVSAVVSATIAAIGANQYAQGTAVAADGSETLWVRRSGTPGNYSGYTIGVYDDGFNYSHAIMRVSGGAYTTISPHNVIAQAGVWRLEANGTTIKLYQKGSLVYSVTDSTYSTGQPATDGFADGTVGSL